MDNCPIGIFDSGSGGLSVWKSIVSLLPKENIIYIGDHANVPYSNKTRTFIRQRAKKIISYLLAKKAKMIIVACNSATVAGIDWYRKLFPNVPIIGVVPTIKTAASMTKTHCFCVLSTTFTAKSVYQRELIRQFAPHDEVFSLGSSKLTTYIESTKKANKKIEQEVKKLFETVHDKSYDVLVLGCTHYPFIRNVIEKIFGKIPIIDSGPAVARHVRRVLWNNGIQKNHGKGTYIFYTTGDRNTATIVAGRLLGKPIVVEHVSIP